VNAIDATSSVSDRPRVITALQETELVISFEDSGLGIDSDSLDRIFEPFFTTKPCGMGLGLWLSRRIVENHGGWLTGSSVPGRGSIFPATLSKGKGAMTAAP